MNVTALQAITAAVQAGLPPPELYFGPFEPGRTYPVGAVTERHGALWMLSPDGLWIPQTAVGSAWGEDA